MRARIGAKMGVFRAIPDIPVEDAARINPHTLSASYDYNVAVFAALGDLSREILNRMAPRDFGRAVIHTIGTKLYRIYERDGAVEYQVWEADE